MKQSKGTISRGVYTPNHAKDIGSINPSGKPIKLAWWQRDEPKPTEYVWHAPSKSVKG